MVNNLKQTKFNENKNILKSEKGAALITVIIFTIVLVSFVIAMLAMARNDTKLSTLQRDSTKAFYLAESGIEDALSQLNLSIIENLENDETVPFGPIGTATEYYEGTITARGVDGNPMGEVEIISTGTVKGNGVDAPGTGKRTVRVIARLESDASGSTGDDGSEDGGGHSYPYDKAILANSTITIQGSPGATIINENPDAPAAIHSNDTIEVNGPCQFEGVATASGSSNPFDNTEDKRYTHVDLVSIPPVPYSQLEQLAQDAPPSYSPVGTNYFTDGFDSKDYGASNFEFTGVVYVIGDVVFRNGYSLTINDGALVVLGSVTFKNGSNLTINRTEPPPAGAYTGPLGLAATGDILLHAKSSSIDGVVQSDGNIDFRNKSTVYGSVVAEQVWMHNKTTIVYKEYDFEDSGSDPGSGSEDGGDSGGTGPAVSRYTRISWQEI